MPLFIRFSFLILALCLSLSLSCQDGQRLIRRYGSVPYNLQQRLDHQDVRENRSRQERLIPRFTDHSALETVKIPIVFNVLTPIFTEPIDQRRILAQLNELNLAFNSIKEYPKGIDIAPVSQFDKVKANPRIEFCLPRLSPEGIPASAIRFKTLPSSVPQDLDLLKRDIFGLNPWDTKYYVNIWIAPLPDSIAGFAQLPSGIASLDGIVIDPRYLADLVEDRSNAYRKGHTLVHLLGNYLGLRPLWGEGNCSDDGIADTPIHNEPNFGAPQEGHVSTCYGYPLEMWGNYMDATDDEFTYFFTEGQVNRMRHTLSQIGERNGLTKPFECAANDNVYGAVSPQSILSAAQHFPEMSMLISPNPSSGIFQVVPKGMPKEGGVLTVIDPTGKKIFSYDVIENSFTPMDLSSLAKGVYFLRLESSGTFIMQKILLQ